MQVILEAYNKLCNNPDHFHVNKSFLLFIKWSSLSKFFKRFKPTFKNKNIFANFYVPFLVAEFESLMLGLWVECSTTVLQGHILNLKNNNLVHQVEGCTL
jgi:hypothetical protein